jgi:restriction system protein
MGTEINPKFLRFFIPIIEALKELGGSGTPTEVIDLAISNLGISEKELEKTNKNGGSTVINEAQWAKLYLVKGGNILSSQRGIWTLTDKAITDPLTEEKAVQIIKAQRKKYRDSKKVSKNKNSQENDPSPDLEDNISLLDVLKSLSPSGFERLSQRLLRESGFQEVKVTGKSGDGGIDGYGILQVNPLVSFNVLFQCKRYSGSVGSSVIRDFRGAMLGRADKGIIITTGTFTAEARKEARRDGAPPVELVDGDKLVEMFKKLELGLIPKTIYEIDDDFFEEYK